MTGRMIEGLDIVAVMSLFIALASYEEVVNRNDFEKVITDIHYHLTEQDKLLHEIKEMLNNGTHNG